MSEAACCPARSRVERASLRWGRGRRINSERRKEETNLKKAQREKILSRCRVRQQPFEKRRGIQKKAGGFFLSGRSDLVSSKLLDPSTHSLSRLLSEIQNDVGILIKVKNGKVFLGVDNNRILP